MMDRKSTHTAARLLTLAALLGASSTAFAKFDVYPKSAMPGPSSESVPMPWFTGPLLAPSSLVIPKGHANIEPYYNNSILTGLYGPDWKNVPMPNFYSKKLQVPIQIGLVDRLDFEIVPAYVWNYTQGKSYDGIGDMTLLMDIQLVPDIADSWVPIVKLAFTGNAPLGKYKRLTIGNLATDSLGSGSWFPGMTLVFSKLIRIGRTKSFINTRLGVNYSVGTQVIVRGLNSYGGDPTTKGKVYPGNYILSDLAFEVNFTQNWVFAMDIVYNHYNKSRFSGTTIRQSKIPSSEVFSLAPALEYNWSENVGVIGGIWFSAKGRNTINFTTGMIALNIYI